MYYLLGTYCNGGVTRGFIHNCLTQIMSPSLEHLRSSVVRTHIRVYIEMNLLVYKLT